MKLKTFLPYIIGGILLVLVMIVLGLNQKPSYEISLKEMHDITLKRENLTDPSNLETMANNPDYVFIDLRAPHEFVNGHIPGAVNIPIHELLESDHEKLLESGKILVLYAKDQVDACAPWMLLQQLGVENSKVLMGGYLAAEKILAKDSLEKEKLLNETARYNYNEFKGAVKQQAAGEKPQKRLPPMRKKTQAAEGGC